MTLVEELLQLMYNTLVNNGIDYEPQLVFPPEFSFTIKTVSHYKYHLCDLPSGPVTVYHRAYYIFTT